MLAERVRDLATSLCADPRRPEDSGPSAVVVRLADRQRDLASVAVGFRQTQLDGSRLATPPPVAPDAVFDLGSVTKVAATTALALRLRRLGELDLDRPVRAWLPRFNGDGCAEVTVRHLLEHRAGLWEWWPTYVSGARTPHEAVDLVTSLPLRYAVDAGRHYSDLGFMLLGGLVESAYGGERLDVVARRELYEPLGMDDTGFRPDGVGAAGSDRVVATAHGDAYERRMVETGRPYPVPVDATAFTGWRTHTKVGDVDDGNAWHAFGGVAGHAGLFSTAADLVAFGRALLASLDGADETLWPAPALAEALTPGRDPGQGLGFRLEGVPTAAGPVPVAGHPGFPGVRFGVLPTRGRVAVLLTNRLHTPRTPVTLDAPWRALLTLAATEEEAGSCG